ncbi:Protein of unknown function [Klenkia marina]|uniref:DUF3017 domain-containing protein n=1 Tax=Klenkia marina TaxID=1960309 RepID=A0A1G4Y1F5_9ACTN|nr:DUF3017 domain-containing protein [Klenkia marina]SCX47262.1 Protein of unknown function [Klenkia marina]
MARAPLHTRRPFLAGVLRQLPLTGVLLVVAVGLLTVASGNWRRGLLVMGLALIAAGVLRMVLPVRRQGFLAVRSTVTDVLLTTGGGVALALVAVAIPPG